MSNRRKPPAPPAAYNPQPTPKVLQLKKGGRNAVKAPATAATPSLDNRPLKQPAAYRPQPSPRVLQTKKSAAPQPGPPIVRSGPNNAVIQRARELQEVAPPPDLPINRFRATIRELQSPQVNERGFFFRRSTKEVVDGLFRAFLGIGFCYDLGISISTCVLGNSVHSSPLEHGQRVRDNFGGNCIAMAHAFAEILEEADIRAKVVQVRKEEPGKAFVVFCPNFIDREVTGHIKKNGTIWNFHYLFTNHSAVWVPSMNKYYDPMAGTTYNNLNEAIEMELVALDHKGDVYKGQYLGQEYVLTRRGNNKPVPGNFSKFDMELVSVGSVATPLGIFKDGDK